MDESAGFIVLRNGQVPWILLLKHLNSGEWDLPKGHLQPGETRFQAAKRELSEETQISLDNTTLPLGDRSFSYGYNSPSGVSRLITLYIAQTVQEPVISEEHRGYIWASLDEAISLLKHHEICECITGAIRSLATPVPQTERSRSPLQPKRRSN